MTIRIDLGTGLGSCVGSGVGIYTESGQEITGVLKATINIEPNEIVTATLLVALDQKSDLRSLTPIIGLETLQELAASHGLELNKTAGTL